jgi:hypothetical protein
MNPEQWIVITSIQAPTPPIADVSRLCANGWSGVVVGDTKTPADWAAPNIDFIGVDEQRKQFGEFADRLPLRHYARKNLGYLYAVQRGARVILETDDDNFPGERFGVDLRREVVGDVIRHSGWVNVYRYFTDELIWPRGLPLTEIHSAPAPERGAARVNSPIQQFLADDDPDVDAIYRLLYREKLRFAQRPPVILGRGAWCPFNSQATVFFEEAFPLLYLPGFVSIRMTDIWRSFVAQAALWAHGHCLSFQSATVHQVRNDHDLMRDFADEIPGYTGNEKIRNMLEDELSLSSQPTIAETGRQLWRRLIAEGVVPETERPAMEGWFDWWRERA